MIRITFMAVMLATAASAQETKEQYCGETAKVVSAIQQARLDRVSERKVPETLQSSDKAWDSRYDSAIPLLVPWVYEQKMRDVRKVDLAAAWSEVCTSNWDAFKDQLR